MLFNSVIFIAVFLPIALTGWFLLNRLKKPFYAKAFLTGMSLWFYGYYNLSYLWILLGSIFFNYGVSWLLAKTDRPGGRRRLLGMGLAGNLGLLFYYKYFNFFVDNCNFFFHGNIVVEEILLPLGISFFTFQQLSYLAERYRGTIAHGSFWDYSCFISFFPQLVAGPIVLYQEFVPQLQSPGVRRPSWDSLYDGFSLFILGLAKKVLLADTLAVVVNAEFDNILYLDALSAWAVVFFFVFELYFDFSGYSDMARGLGRMFGFRLPENFNAPLTAVSVKDFWRRWHMTLSRFLMTYIYFPLGGNRKGKARQCLNLAAVFLVSGIWHGASWNFVLWGCIHGLAVIWETIFPKLRFRWKAVNQLVTGIFLALAWVPFRCATLSDAVLLWRKLFAGGYTGMFAGICNQLQLAENYAVRKFLEIAAPQYVNLFYMLNYTVLLGICVILVTREKAEVWIAEKGRTARGTFCMATLFTWSFISLSQVSIFLYFNF
ncbi:MBOAT family protein [Acetatifactor muris]|uniref:Peptidoglycan O-acetyltransferase n=1 Tax=Acetatifactor muris TaxID=879566 RepID=A0A2K4ZN82_9FIRM|nr:MBOAT family O-acyltransferase [Acetatifactor muris]MCR2050299.1 MBOAT family protein [Acetatifactor muris]SOY31943.1 Peptidoglycan O-acetyltransferase [Acetatifactor muris]